jgi:riboflavin biosynthesis pyrimidine reductase
MSDLAPLDTLYEAAPGADLPLPPELAALYGRFPLALPPDRPTVVANFVASLDGVVSLGIPGQAGGGEISGFNPHDRMVMGLLRAVADAVIVGAGTLQEARDHLWTADYIYPPLTSAYRRLRASLGKDEPPLNVVVTASGDVDPRKRIFRTGEVPALVVTTARGAARLRARDLPSAVRVAPLPGDDTIGAAAILAAILQVRPGNVILTEGGPHLMGDFFAERCLDELFLTLAPQVAGRDDATTRPGLVAGRTFAPEHPLWSTLLSVKRAESHLFLRYALDAA